MYSYVMTFGSFLILLFHTIFLYIISAIIFLRVYEFVPFRNTLAQMLEIGIGNDDLFIFLCLDAMALVILLYPKLFGIARF